MKQAFLESEWELSGLRSGKVCEVLLRVVQDELHQPFAPLGKKIGNLQDDCDRLGRLPATTGSESLRIVIPRGIAFAYTLRNKRGIGHIGGDVDANEIDARAGVQVVDWCIAELIRVVHTLSLEEAQELLDSIAERKLPAVWDVLGRKRVMVRAATFRDKVLLLLHASPPSGVPAEDLCAWVEHKLLSRFRREVLAPAHRERLLEFDKELDLVILSPSGTTRAEDLLRELSASG